MSSQKIRELELKVALERHYAEAGIPRNRRDFLADGVNEVPAGKAYILASETSFDIREIADQIAHTDRGSLALDAENKRAEADAAEIKLQAILAIKNPSERIKAAREAGLA